MRKEPNMKDKCKYKFRIKDEVKDFDEDNQKHKRK